MRDAEKSVFISYRRSVSRHLARSIALDLRAHGYDVFFDVDTVDSGEFDRIVLQQIAQRTHFVLVLSRGALERCADEGDWLRREIETALHLKRNIVPVFEANFSFSVEAKHLPESIRDLPRFNGIPIYYGGETGLEGDFAEDGRRTMPWDSLDQDLIAYFKHAIHTRRGSEALRLGEVEAVVIDDEQRVYAFRRWYEDQVVYCAFNASDEAAEIRLPPARGTWHDALGDGNAIEARDDALVAWLEPRGAAWFLREG